MLLVPRSRKSRITIENSINVNGFLLEKSIRVLLYSEDVNPGSNIKIPITINGKGGRFKTFTIEVNFKYDEHSSAMYCTYEDIQIGNPVDERDFISINIFNAHLHNAAGYTGIDEKVKLYDLLDEVNSTSIYLQWLFTLSPGDNGSRFGQLTIMIYSRDCEE